MPEGKPAGVVCLNLDLGNYQCTIWGTDQYPQLCRDFRPDKTTCGGSQQEAIQLINQLELSTR
jgi:hypothetical protein